MHGSPDIGPGTRMLLRLWRGLNEPDYRAEVEQNWESLLAACDYHQVGPIVFHRFQGRVAVPSQVLEHLRARFYHVSAYNHRLAMHLVQLFAEFEQQRIPCLALKGPAVAMAAYGDLSLRQYEDIDIMVHTEDVAKAVEMLMAGGFQPSRGQAERYKHLKLDHEVTLTAPDNSYSVDLHWQLAPPYARVFGPAVREVWLRAEHLQLPHGSVAVRIEIHLIDADAEASDADQARCMFEESSRYLRGRTNFNGVGFMEGRSQPDIGKRFGMLLAGGIAIAAEGFQCARTDALEQQDFDFSLVKRSFIH
jgi:hypothetical protein